MNALVANKMVDNYFRFIRIWDNESKKILIIKLTDSISLKPKIDIDFSSCFGARDDNRSADQIYSELRADRVNNIEEDEF